MIKKLAKSIREYKKQTILTPLSVAVEVVLEVIVPYFMALLIDEGINKSSIENTVKIGLALVAFTILSLVFGAVSGIFAAKAGSGFAKNLRKDLYYKVQTFSFANIDKFSTSSIVTRLTTDVTYVQNAFQMIIRVAIRAPLMLIFSLIMAVKINKQISIIFLVLIPILAAILFVISRLAMPVFEKVFKKYDDLNNIVEENTAGMRVVKSFYLEEEEEKKFKNKSKEIFELFSKANRILAFNSPTMQFAMYGAMILISWIGARTIVLSGSTELTTGELTSLITYSIQILFSIMMLTMISVMVTISTASAKRIVEVLEEEPSIKNEDNPIMEVPNGNIEFKNVGFSYVGKREKEVLKNINISIKSGETVGIVGGTGVGKSSLVNLIPRLYDVTDGELLVGGNNVKKYDIKTLRDSVACVLQKNVLFSGTIKENLRWGNEQATDEELIEACKLAQADGFINDMPDKYDTYIEQGGTNVSGGQKQRICIARALVKKPKILILDDSTSAVDTKTDKLIRDAFQTKIPDTTKIIIAQRISSVEECDKIIVMDQGIIDAVGTHEELVKSNKIYREVYESQTQEARCRCLKGGRMEDKRPQIKLETIKRLLKIVAKGNKTRLFFVLICIVISSIVSVSAPLFTKKIIDEYITPLLTIDNPDFSGLKMLILTMAAVFGIGILANLIYNLLLIPVTQGTLKKVRDTMFTKMQKLPIKYFDTNTHGDVMSHYTNDTDTMERMIADSMPQLISSVLSLITVVISMFALSWQLTIFVFVFLVIMLKATKAITKRSGSYFIGQQDTLGKVNGYIEEMINGQKVVKVFNYEERAEKNFDKINEDLYNNMVNANKFSNILMPILNNLGNIEYVLVAILGAALAISGKVPSLTIGVIASFLALTRSFNQPIKNVSSQVNMIIMGMAGASRVFALIDEEPEIDEGYVTLVDCNIDESGNITESDKPTGHWAWKHQHHDGTLSYIELKGHIEFENVNFGYEENKEILHDISLYAKPGQKIAFVGATGAGKTTITNLINRFYEIKEGKIRYDGINIQKIKKYDLRRSLGLVLQDTNLFTGTIKENIKYGKPDATDEEVIAAAKIANAHEFISALPEGYDTMLTQNASGLSQGQRQLLSIARCAINNPPVMILDEATSSIDTRTEKLVQEGMDKLMEGRTVFVIAHRLSTVRNSKAIIVLEHGKIIERGTHEQLLEEKGQYYQLYTGAFELE